MARALVGYSRVSTRGQLLDRQLHALKTAGCIRVFADKQTGKNTDRPELTACFAYLRPGDALVVLIPRGLDGRMRTRWPVGGAYSGVPERQYGAEVERDGSSEASM